jgi:DNA recombination protein Rad52
MSFSPEQFGELSGSLDPRYVKRREQAGRTFSYIEAWHCIAEANRIFGYDGWDREMAECKCVAERETKVGQPPKERDGWRVGYIARVRIAVRAGEQIVIREGTGYGSGIDVDLGQAHESAIKEAESDAMKRALTTFGNPFGLSLYDKGNPVHPTSAATRVATSVDASRKQPASASEGRTLSQIRDGLHRALSIAGTAKLVDDILMVNQAELQLIKGASAQTHARLVAYAEQRKTELVDAPANGLADEVAERLGV